MTDYKVELYDGVTRAVYASRNLGSFAAGESEGGFKTFSFRITDIVNTTGGVALSYQGTLISGQFLSYGGTFVAIEGDAQGEMSIDIGVTEDNFSDSFESLQLSGNGTAYSDFNWIDNTQESFGQSNFGQTFNFAAGSTPPVIGTVLNSPSAPSANTPVNIAANIQDEDDFSSIMLRYGTESGNLVALENMIQDGDSNIFQTQNTLPTNPEGTTVYYQITATDNSPELAVTTSIEYSYTIPSFPPPPGLTALKIVEIMNNPASVTDAQGEYFEVYNNSNYPFDMEGWIIKDSGSDTHRINTGFPLIVRPREFLVLGNNAASASNGGVIVDYEYDNIDLNDANDQIILQDISGNLISQVNYDTAAGWPVANGASMVYNGLFNESPEGSLWSTATNSLGINIDYGSPGFEGYDQFISNVFVYENNSWTPEIPANGLNVGKAVVKNGDIEVNSLFGLRSLQTRAGSSFNVLGANFLVITGDIIANGPINISQEGALSAPFDFDQTFKGNATIQTGNLIATGSKRLNVLCPFDIFSLLSIDGTALNIENTFTLKSSEEHTAMVNTISNDSFINGDVTVERFIPAKRAFRFLTSAVNTTTTIQDNWQEGASSATDDPNPGFGTHITGSASGANGFDITNSGTHSMFTLNNPSQSFQVVTNTDAQPLVAGKPFLTFVRGSRGIDLSNNNALADDTILRATGQLATGNQTQSYTTTSGNTEFFLIGNPYQSSVDMTEVYDGSEVNLNTNFYYIWDPSIGGLFGNGGYITIDLTNLTNNGGPTGSETSEANQYLQPGQGAFLLTTMNPPVGSTISVTFKEEDKVVGQDTNTFDPETSSKTSNETAIKGYLYTQDAFEANAGQSGGFIIYFGSNFSNTASDEDAIMPYNLDENIGIKNDEILLSIERRATPENDEIITLYNDNYRNENYTLRIDVDTLENTNTYLLDHFTGSSTLLNTGENYINYSVSLEDESSAQDRFNLIFKSENLSIEENTLSSTLVYPNPVNDTLFINTTEGNNFTGVVTITNVLGQKIVEKKVDISTGIIKLQDLNCIKTGVYLLTLVSKDQSITKRIIKN